MLLPRNAVARDDLQKNMEALEELENIGSC